MVIAAPTVDRLPAGRSDTFYGPTSREWNPFYPCTRQTIGEYAAAVARLHSFDATVLPFEDGYSLLVNADPADGLGLLLIDAWASLDEHLAEQLRELDSLNLEWVGVMVPWNVEDEQTRQHADELRRALQAVLPNHLGAGRTFTPGVSAKIGTLQQFRTNLPEVMEAALFRYLNRVDAHPPAGDIPRRPRLGGLEEQAG